MANQTDRKHIAERTAKMLIDIEALGARPEEPFTLTSGTKSPVYIDCRRLISFVSEREEVIGFLEEVVRDAVDGPIDAVAGGETAGIPYAAFLSWKMGLPMLYVRKKPKGFGKHAMVEGNFKEGTRVVLVEDLIFDGGSKVNFINGLRMAGLEVNHAFTIASYGFSKEYEKTLGAIGVKVSWLTDWPAIVEVAERTGYFSPETADMVREFLADPHTWSRARGGK
ncbi:MAG TPA: orotate phosphoribosyltransferase [Firmicutes bacterium]|nr:orotate phosphoribosyltransferase [Bacillota bacterium]